MGGKEVDSPSMPSPDYAVPSQEVIGVNMVSCPDGLPPSDSEPPELTEASPAQPPESEDAVSEPPVPELPPAQTEWKEWVLSAVSGQKYICANGLTICSQPAGWITDYLLGAVAWIFAAILVTREPDRPEAHDIRSVAVFHTAFLAALGVVAILGGAIHQMAYHKVMQCASGACQLYSADGLFLVWWRCILFLSSLPNIFLLSTGLWITMEDDWWAFIANLCATALFLAIGVAVAVSRRILVHNVVSLPTILFYGGSGVYRIETTTGIWIVIGATTMLIGGAVSALRVAPSPKHFNHNALLHLCLIGVCSCIFVGSLSLD